MVTSRLDIEMIPKPDNNGPLTFEKKIINVVNGPLHLFTLVSSSEKSPPSSLTMDSETSTIDSIIPKTYEDRLSTFTHTEWKLECVTPRKMAKAGFYYTGIKDSVKCDGCFTVFENWTQGDHPLTVHQRISPLCSFLKEFIGYDVCGIYKETPSTISPEIAQRIQQFLNSVVVKLDDLKYKQYSNIEIRLKSFDKCKIKILQDYKSLSEAGFFYVGDGNNDVVMCFYCGQNLSEWEVDDQPWTEHARWSPECIYLLLCKGKGFVENVHRVKNVVPVITSENQKMVSDASVPDPNIEVHELENSSNRCSSSSIIENRIFIEEKINNSIDIFDRGLIDSISIIGNLNTISGREFNNRLNRPIKPESPEPMDDNQVTQPMDGDQVTQPMGGNQVTQPIDDSQVTQLMDGSQVTEPMNDSQITEPMDDNQVTEPLDCNQATEPMDGNQATEPMDGNQATEPVDNNQASESMDGSKVTEPLSKAQSSLPENSDVNAIPDSIACKICFKDEIKMACIPCGHFIACTKCALTLDQCAVCRKPFNMVLMVYMHDEKEENEGLSQLPVGPSQDSIDQMLCKVCNTNDMDVVFLPCRHMYACIKCASEIRECSVCLDPLCAFMQVYL